MYTVLYLYKQGNREDYESYEKTLHVAMIFYFELDAKYEFKLTVRLKSFGSEYFYYKKNNIILQFVPSLARSSHYY